MNSILRLTALAMFVALAISATTATFSSPVARNTASASVVAYTNGVVVSLSAAGWIYGDAITVTAGTPLVVWTTLLSSTGLTGVGIAAASCATPISATTVTANTLIGTGINTCPADVATVYTTATPTGTTSTAAVAASALVANQAVSWTLTQPATTTGNVLGVSISNNGGAAIVGSDAATPAASSGTGAQRYAVATLNYAFYVETATSASVCFQTAAQHTASASCGSAVTTSSAGTLSAAISGFVAMIALIFFN